MGKKRVNQLLEQLKINQELELQNSAAVFTIAQVAINELRGQETADLQQPIAELPAAPPLLDKAELLQRYGSYNGCRQAAKAQGIKFKSNPTWKQLELAFSYREVFQQLVTSYFYAYPSREIQGISIELKVE